MVELPPLGRGRRAPSPSRARGRGAARPQPRPGAGCGRKRAAAPRRPLPGGRARARLPQAPRGPGFAGSQLLRLWRCRPGPARPGAVRRRRAAREAGAARALRSCGPPTCPRLTLHSRRTLFPPSTPPRRAVVKEPGATYGSRPSPRAARHPRSMPGTWRGLWMRREVLTQPRGSLGRCNLFVPTAQEEPEQNGRRQSQQ